MADSIRKLWKRMHDQRGFLSFNQQNFLICTQIVPGLCFSVGPPDLYLFGALTEAAPFLRDGEMLAVFAARLDAALTEARMRDVLATMAVGDACEALVNEAYENGSRDNITAVVLRAA